MNKSRVEALTDGIIAIAATIMVLELGIPAANDLSSLLVLRHTFLAYVNSFLMIYIVWSMHHDLFHKAKSLSRRSFLVNGIWVFLLTLVPFTTAWVGSAVDETLPELIYPLNLLLWRLAFQWLDYQIKKDNPDIPREFFASRPAEIFVYAVYIICMALAFVVPRLSIYVIGTLTLAMFTWYFIKGKNAS